MVRAMRWLFYEVACEFKICGFEICAIAFGVGLT